MSDSLTSSRSIDMTNNSNLQDMIRVISNRVNVVSNDQQRLDAEVRHSQNSLQTVTENLFLMKESCEDIASRARGLKNTEDLLAQQIWSLKQVVHNALSTSFDGTYIWKITGVREKLGMH